MKLLARRGQADGSGAWLRCDVCGRRQFVRDTESLTGRQARDVALNATIYHDARYGCRGVLTWDDGVSSADRVPAVADARGLAPRGGRDVRTKRARRRARGSDARSCAVGVLMILGAWLGASIVLGVLWALTGLRWPK